MTGGRGETALACVNLLAPGTGMVLLGATRAGLLSGLAFTASANYALWALLLIPDDFPAWARDLGLALAGLTYVGAQIGFAQSLRSRTTREKAQARREALASAQLFVARGELARALDALERVRPLGESDLLVAYRLAQLYTQLGEVEAGLAAWRRVRALDPHRIYREELRAGEQALAGLRPEHLPRDERAPPQPPAKSSSA